MVPLIVIAKRKLNNTNTNSNANIQNPPFFLPSHFHLSRYLSNPPHPYPSSRSFKFSLSLPSSPAPLLPLTNSCQILQAQHTPSFSYNKLTKFASFLHSLLNLSLTSLPHGVRIYLSMVWYGLSRVSSWGLPLDYCVIRAMRLKGIGYYHIKSRNVPVFRSKLRSRPWRVAFSPTAIAVLGALTTVHHPRPPHIQVL